METQMLVRNRRTTGCKAPAATPRHSLGDAARAEVALHGSVAGPAEGMGQPNPGQNAALGIALSQKIVSSGQLQGWFSFVSLHLSCKM